MPETMQAARFYATRQPLRVETVPVPEIGAQEVLVAVKACGLCGTDVHIALEGSVPTFVQPVTLGHEVAGMIAAVGAQVQDWQEGDRVGLYGQTVCGSCFACRSGRDALCIEARILGMHRDGGFAQYIRVPAANLFRLPDRVPFEVGAILTDAVATPYHALRKRGQLQAGEIVAIFGCGGLGMHAIQLAHLHGAAQIIAVDVVPAVLERATDFGANMVIDASQENPVRTIRSLTDGLGVDLALECVGLSRTIDQAVKSLRRGGRAVVVGIGAEPITLVPSLAFAGSEYQLIGSFGSDREDVTALLRLVANGKLNLSRSISGTLSLEEINAGLERLAANSDHPIRLVVTP